jgi:hypothetical protein
MDKKALRAIATTFGPPDEVQWFMDEDNRAMVRAGDWDWEIERLPAPLAVSSTFKGEMYQATPDVYTSGGAGLRSRWFAVTGDRVINLQDADDMRWFLESHVSWESPAKLAELLERCQGQGRVANVYQANGLLERRLDERSRSAVGQLGLTEPVMKGNELTFYSWRIVMDGREEAIEVEQWSLSTDGPNGPEWRFTRLPGLLRFGD